MTTHLNRRLFGTGLGALGLAGGMARAAATPVVVGTWGGDYQTLQQRNIVDAIVAPSGLPVTFDPANDTARKAKLMAERALPQGTLDVAVLTASGSYEMFSNGVLDELDETRVPNLRHVLPSLRTPYSAPHIQTGRMIVYHPKLVARPPTAFADLWDPANDGKVGIVDTQYQAAIEAAALVAGGSLTDYEPGKEKLLALKKRGLKVYASVEAMAQALRDEEAGLCIMSQARGISLQQAGVPVEVVVPREGVVLSIFDMSIPRNAKNKSGAYAYLDAMLDPRSQAAFAQTMGYAPTVSNAALEPDLSSKVLLPPEVQKTFMVQNQEYLAKNDPQLQEWWTKVFKA